MSPSEKLNAERYIGNRWERAESSNDIRKSRRLEHALDKMNKGTYTNGSIRRNAVCVKPPRY